jgi:hypothetical protein
MNAPLSDAVIIAISRLVDDAQMETREPSHSDIEFQIARAGLQAGDPKGQGQLVGKAKRVRNTLNWALENNISGGQKLVDALISLLRGCGGFRSTSSNFVGSEVIADVAAALRTEGYELTSDGELRPLLLDNLSGTALTAALESYVRRAKRGVDDAALVTGTGKDLLEATAAHILVERYNSYASSSNFPTLLGQAFSAIGMVTSQHPVQSGEAPQRRLERAMFEIACAINNLRNKTGTGHGRPWLPSVSDSEARTAIQFMGTIAERMLEALKNTP